MVKYKVKCKFLTGVLSMKIPSFEKNKYTYLITAFCIPFLGMLMLMLVRGFEPFGNSSMLYSDMYHQYYPFFVEFRKALLSGESPLWSWSVGMGMDYLGLISYYLASPLNLLSILVPDDLVLEYFSLLMPIKLGLASLFFAIFLQKSFHRNDLSIALFGGFYGLCAWALGYQWNIMWLDTFALLPLVALGTVALLRDKKFILYTITLFLSIYSNYYIGLFTCIFVFLSFFCYQICRWSGFKRFFLDLCRIALFSLLAIGMTMILELPALAALKNTQSSVNEFPTTFRLNIVTDHTLEGLWDAMRQVAGNMGGGLEPTFKEGLPNLYCGVGTIIMAFLFLTAKKVKFRDKLCCLFLLVFFIVSFIIRQLDYIWHGFHFTNMIPYRFSFLYSFVMLYMAYRAYLLHRTFKPWQFIIAGILTVAVLSCSNELQTTMSIYTYNLLPFAKSMGLENTLLLELPFYALYNGLLVAIYMVVFFHGKSQMRAPRDTAPEERQAVVKKQIATRNTAVFALAGVMLLELALNIICFGVNFAGTNISSYPRGTTYSASMIRYMQEREADTLFYRAEVAHAQTLNDGALNGYDGVSTFTSSANVNTTLFMQALGYGAKNTYNRYCFEESSPISNLFLDLKYMLERDGDVEPNPYFTEVHHYGDVYLLENQAYLPLGFLANTQLSNVEFLTTGNRFELQNDLMEAATGIGGDYWTSLPKSSLEIVADKATLTSKSSSGYAAYKTEERGSVTFIYTIDRSGFLCIDLTLPKRNNFTVSLNNVVLYTESYSLPQMIAVSQVEPGDEVEIRFTCAANESGTLNVNACVLNEEQFYEAYEVLSASTLELTEFSTTYVEGTINANRDGLMYTSIPQDGNWYVTVDGVAVEPVLVGDVMIGVPMTAGEHTVAFTYNNKAFNLGWKISLGCLAVFLILIRVYYGAPRKKGKYER